MVPEPDERGHDVVLRRHRAQHLRRLRLTERGGKVEALVGSDRRGHRRRSQLVESREPELGEHLGLLGGRGTQVTLEERVGRAQLVRHCHRCLALVADVSG